MSESRYIVTGMDSAADGMERLRNWNECILLAYPAGDSTVSDLREQWQADLDACEREDGFDYEAAREAIATYCGECAGDLERELSAVALYESGCNASGLPADEWDDSESFAFRLYVTDTSATR